MLAAALPAHGRRAAAGRAAARWSPATRCACRRCPDPRRPRWWRTCPTTSPCRWCCTCWRRCRTLRRGLVHGAGRGRRPAGRAARVEGLRRAEREGGLVRRGDPRRRRAAGRCSGRCPTSTPGWCGSCAATRRRRPRPAPRCSPSSTPRSPSAARRCGPRWPAGPARPPAAEDGAAGGRDRPVRPRRDPRRRGFRPARASNARAAKHDDAGSDAAARALRTLGMRARQSPTLCRNTVRPVEIAVSSPYAASRTRRRTASSRRRRRTASSASGQPQQTSSPVRPAAATASPATASSSTASSPTASSTRRPGTPAARSEADRLVRRQLAVLLAAGDLLAGLGVAATSTARCSPATSGRAVPRRPGARSSASSRSASASRWIALWIILGIAVASSTCTDVGNTYSC